MDKTESVSVYDNFLDEKLLGVITDYGRRADDQRINTASMLSKVWRPQDDISYRVNGPQIPEGEGAYPAGVDLNRFIEKVVNFAPTVAETILQKTQLLRVRN